MANGAPDDAVGASGDPSMGAAAAAGDDAAPPPAEAVPGPLRVRHTLTGHTRAVAAVKLCPVDSGLLASASADQTVRLWRIGGGGSSGGGADADAAGPREASPAGGLQHGSGANDVAWGPLGNHLASVADDGAARLWDAETGACLRVMPGHTNYAYCCQFDPAGSLLATGSFDETLRFWDVRCGRLLRETPAHSDPVTCLSYSFDGTLLASGSFDGLVRVWDARNGHCLRSYASSAASAPVNDVALAPNAQYYLQATLDHRLRLVHLETGRCAKTYAGHRNEDFCCGATFAAAAGGGAGGGGGAAVASGSEDGSLCVWGLNTRKLLQRELGAAAGGASHGGAVLCVTAHPSLPLVVTGGQDADCAIKVWAAA
ncbi:MAG: transcriptional repression protein [Monoraphidium minutum]|nr:MAG: transcriptional repression protein [Monoraphidium minutum]